MDYESGHAKASFNRGRLRSWIAAGSALLLVFVLSACSADGSPDLFRTPAATQAPATPTATAVPTRTPTPVPLSSPRPMATPIPTLPAGSTPTVARPTATPTRTPTPTPVPALEEFVLYASGRLQDGFGVDSWNFPLPDPAYEGRRHEGHATLSKDLFIDGESGEFMSVYSLRGIDLARFTHVRFTVSAISGPGAWLSVMLAIEPYLGGDASEVIHVPPGRWETFTVPLDALISPGYAGRYVGIGFAGEPGPDAYPSNAVAFADIRLVRIPDVVAPVLVSAQDVTDRRIRVTFSEEVAAGSALAPGSYSITSATDPAFAQGRAPSQVVPLPSGRSFDLILDRSLASDGRYVVTVSGVQDATGNGAGLTTSANMPVSVQRHILRVNSQIDIYPFNPNMRGVAVNTWNWVYGGLENVNSPKRAALLEAAKQINPGVIRFAGGLWVNGTGWDRSNTAPADGEWTYTDPQSGRETRYRHSYRASLIDSYAAFAKELGAETVVQVNICDNNPAMWADLVRYTNVERNYNFRYWELGNELDLDRCAGEQEYAARFVEYSRAMKAVDPSIRIMGPVPSMPYKTGWYNALYAQSEASIDVLSFHWYQLTEWTTNTNAFAYQGGSIEALMSYNRAVGTACNEGFGCPGDLIQATRLDRMTYRRGIVESVSADVISRYRNRNPHGETAITEMGPHASAHEHPINGNHLAALWLADMLGRWAYNGLDMLTYYSLEDGGTGAGNTRGLVGIDDAAFMDVRPTFYAEWLYAQHFGDMMVRTSTTDINHEVVVWASRDTSDPNVLKLILLNMGAERAEAAVQVTDFMPTRGEAYVMSSTDPASIANPASFANHQTTINGVQIPDVRVGNPAAFTAAVQAIQPAPVEVGREFSYSLEPYSAVAITLYR